jgi:hypothetical protein
LLLEAPDRATVQTAYSQYRAATAVCAWGLLYVALGVVWWPAAPAGVTTVIVGYRRGLSTCSVLADLIEATVDTHQHALAAALGVSLPHGRLTPDEGLQIRLL